MDSIRVNKDQVIEHLTANRTKHLAEYTEAMDGWRALASEKLCELASRLDRGESPSDLYVRLDRPENHTEEYDTALGMLGLSVDGEIEMTRTNYQNYILDKWGWSERFAATTSHYSIKQ